MAQIQKVSWRTVGYAALGTAAIVAGTVGIVNSDGVHPTTLKSSASTRWLVDRPSKLLVLADGLSGQVLAKIDIGTDSGSTQQLAYQGAGGAFLVAADDGTVRTISTSKLQLGAPQSITALAKGSQSTELGVGVNGLTVVDPTSQDATLFTKDDEKRAVKVPKADKALVARDGSMWLFGSTGVSHVQLDGSLHTFPISGSTEFKATIGSDAVVLDRKARVVRWVGTRDVDIRSMNGAANAVLQQQRGDDAQCVWIGAGNRMACVGRTRIDRSLTVSGLNIGPKDRLAVAGNVAVVIHDGTQAVQRIDVDTGRLVGGEQPNPAARADLRITSINGMIWIDEVDGDTAWVVHSYGMSTIHKNDKILPTLDAQGQVQSDSGGNGPGSGGGGGLAGDEEVRHVDNNPDVQNAPTAVDDSVTARAGTTLSIPVTANDYDEDGDAFAVQSAGIGRVAGHGSVEVLDGGSVSYVPEPGYTGSDSFDYTIVDETGRTDSATVHVQLLPRDSPNRPPLTHRDTATTREGRAVTVDVLANDIDPERDPLNIATFSQPPHGSIRVVTGPSGVPALKYTPDPGSAGQHEFTYRAADPQGGTSGPTRVTVDVLPATGENVPPRANPDAVRLPAGKESAPINVMANDTDDDGDPLLISNPVSKDPTVRASIRAERLYVTLQANAPERSVVTYTLSDGQPNHEVIGRVLVLRIPDAAPNGKPVANNDADKVAVGNSKLIDVLANDSDPDQDQLTIVDTTPVTNNAGTVTEVNGRLRFTPSVTSLDEPMTVTFEYTIDDGHQHRATAQVTVEILVKPLPVSPTANDDVAQAFVNQQIHIPVLANDSDPSGGLPSLAGDPVCLGGSAVAEADGGVLYTPPLDQTGRFFCTYTVRNSGGGTAKAQITIYVTRATDNNHMPVFIAGRSIDVPLGTTMTVFVNDVATEPDDGDVLSFTSVSQPSLGKTQRSADGASFTYTAPRVNDSVDVPTPTDVSVSVSDGHGQSVNGTVRIRLVAPTGTSEPDPKTRDFPLSGPVGDPIDVTVVDSLRSLNPSTMQLSLTSVVPDAGTSATWKQSGGTVTITPTAAGSWWFTYTVSNASGGTASGRINVQATDKVLPNPAAVAVDDAFTVASGGSVTGFDVLANDQNIGDAGDAPKVVLLSQPTSDFGTALMSNGRLAFSAAPFAQGTQSVQYSVTDGTNPATSTGTVRITIQPCSESAPVANSTSVTIGPSQSAPYDLTAFAVGEIYSVTGAMTTITGTYTPPPGTSGPQVITFKVRNGCNQSATGTYTINVVNNPPVGTTYSKTIAAGQTVNVQPSELATDSEPLTITATNGAPAWVTRAPDGSSIVIAPPAGTPGGFVSFTATVSDPGRLSATGTLNITVDNAPPVAVNDSYYVSEQALFPFDPTLNDQDPDGGSVYLQTIAVTSGPGQIQSGGTNDGTGSNVVTILLGHGVTRLSYTIRDSSGQTASATVTITYNHDPNAPSVSQSTNQPSVTVHYVPTDEDATDQLITDCTASDTAAQAGLQVIVFTTADPRAVDVRITIPANVTGVFIFNCTVNDGYVTQTGTITLTVTG